MSRMEWRSPRYNTGDGEVWNLHRLDNANMHWSILGTIVYLGLTRRVDWTGRLQRWRIDPLDGIRINVGQEIKVKTMEEAKATALALLTLS